METPCTGPAPATEHLSVVRIPTGPQRDAAVTEALASMRATPCTPRVLRGLAAPWPALTRWTFPYLASLGPDTPVRLVLGNRERARTRFADSTLGSYLSSLEQDHTGSGAAPYLKEFNLLENFPLLRADLDLAPLFPQKTWVWNDVWIGPAGSRTGLHRDRLDNLAVMLRGRKRFRLAPPGTVEAIGAVSRKYDRVSVMAHCGFDDLQPAAHGTLHEIDLGPGDAIYTPAGWWHEVENLAPSVFMSGFFGGKPAVVGKWLATLPLHLLHHAGLWQRGNCVCHP